MTGHLRSPDGSTDIPLIGGTDWMHFSENYTNLDARVSVANAELNCDISYRGKLAFTEPIRELLKGVKKTVEWGEGE